VSASTTDPLIGRLIDGRYQVRSRIARGGMATVYLATDLRLERRVAVKVMHGHLADDSQFKQRFIQEARSAARLAHPNVVNVFDQGQDSESAYLVMEYLPGITLRDLLDEYGSLTPQQTIDISEAVLSGLAAAHKAGIIHRDLKPENVLLADDGRIKIGDFGLARAASAHTATGAQLLGTIAYLSPELVTRGVADTRSDIYAVGIMMYEMLTGEQPFTGEQPMQIAYRHANEPLPAPSVRNPKVPRELDELVLWATAKEPDQRPADARVLLEQVRDTESVLDLPATTGPTRAFTQVLPPASGGPRHTSGPSNPTDPNPSLRPDRTLADAATQVLAPRRGAPGSELALAEPRPPGTPRRRRWIPLVAALGVLVLVGGTLGWWFGFGPGSSVTIPSAIAGMSPEDATDALENLGLEVAEERGSAFSPVIPAGAVAETDPAIGDAVARGTFVTLRISQGPEPVAIDFTAGMPFADAETMAERFDRQPDDERFDAAIALGTLIDALAADESSLLEAETYGDQQPITLVRSAGPVPVVAGETEDAARQLLDGVGLVYDAGMSSQENSDTVPEGSVISLVQADGPLRPSDSVGLVVSTGPAPTTVPNIVGMTWAEARDALIAAGLNFRFDRPGDRILAEAAPNESVVTRVDPDEGAAVRRTDTVTVRLAPA
jgi:serine/threonine protein kinase/beta-lactam-binding protein with PASTA domain